MPNSQASIYLSTLLLCIIIVTFVYFLYILNGIWDDICFSKRILGISWRYDLLIFPFIILNYIIPVLVLFLEFMCRINFNGGEL